MLNKRNGQPFPDFDRLNSETFGTVTIRECMALTGITQQKSVLMMIWGNKLKARKADGDEGSTNGVWLIELSSIYERYGIQDVNPENDNQD